MIKGRFVSRAGEKLDAAVEAFGVDVSGCVCADFGCNVGGFSDCLLKRGAARVYAIDTGYGELAWTLRKDPRVVVMERTNALYCPASEPVDMVVIDVAWTPQSVAVPAAVKWLKARDASAGPLVGVVRKPIVISLLKPHYELAKLSGRRPHEAISIERSRQICLQVCDQLGQLGARVLAVMQSVLIGKGGNAEFLLLLELADDPA